MSFDGPALSFDDEGSILFDGEKIIVTVPVGHEALDHLGTEEDIPFPIVYTHPSHHHNQQPSPGTPSLDDNPAFIKEQAQAFNENVRQERESARNMESEPNTPDIPDDLPAETQPEIGRVETGSYADGDAVSPGYLTAESYIDLLHMAEHLRLMGRAYRDSSPEALGVMQDGLLRPFTYSTIFRHFPSCSESMEFIYADPLDVDDCPVIDFARRLWSGHGGASGGSSSNARNDVEETFTLDDVKQFTEIDLATEKFDVADVAYYEKMLNKVFDYEIVIEENYGYSPEKKISQLQNLAKANVHIVNYFAVEAGFKLDENEALEEFKKHFSRTDRGKLKVHLGDNDETQGKYLGRVPLPESSTQKNLDKIYLGSLVDIPTIVHEFGHVMDRNINMTAYLEGRLGDGEFHLSKADSKYGVNLNRDILEYVIEGFVAKQFFGRELLADLFMTAVLSGEGYEVESVKDPTYNEAREIIDDPIAVFATFDDPDGPIFVCGGDSPCFMRVVEWENTNNARVVRAFLPKVFLHARSERERK